MAVTDASHRIIADLLTTRTGQTLGENRRWRVATALSGLFREHGISNVDQLVCLLDGPGQQRLATEIVEALLNNETYFFRDHAFFAALASGVLPELAERRAATRRLSIWSAGCSTGQEALSLAMLLADQGALFAGWTIEILGTDISGKAIAQAKQARYSQFEIQRGIGIAQMLDHFEETPDGWQASDRLRAVTRFQQQNILDTLPFPGRFDLVLCRNVLLYFDAQTRQRAFDQLAASTKPDGWLMLGSGETVIGQSDKFLPSSLGACLYRPAAMFADGARSAGEYPPLSRMPMRRG